MDNQTSLTTTPLKMAFQQFSPLNQPGSNIALNNDPLAPVASNAVGVGNELALTSRLFNYALLGGTVPFPGGPLIGVGLGYGFDRVLDSVNNQSSDSWHKGAISSAGLLGTATMFKNFWLLDWVERNPHNWVSRVIITENIMFNTPLRRKLISDLQYWQKMRNQPGQPKGFIPRVNSFTNVVSRHLTDPTIQRQALGVKGVHRATAAFVDSFLEPLKPWPVLYQAAYPIGRIGRWALESIRGLPVSYENYRWMSQPNKLDFPQKLLRAFPGLMADAGMASLVFLLFHIFFRRPQQSEQSVSVVG